MCNFLQGTKSSITLYCWGSYNQLSKRNQQGYHEHTLFWIWETTISSHKMLKRGLHTYCNRNIQWTLSSDLKARVLSRTFLGLSTFWQNTSNLLFICSSRKKAEYLFKGCIYDAKGISAVPPEDYKNRFLEFLKFEVFKIANHDEMPKKLPVCKKSRSRPKA